MNFILSLLVDVDLFSLEASCKDVRYLCGDEIVWRDQYNKVWKKKLLVQRKGKGKAKGKDEGLNDDISWRDMYKFRKRYELAWRRSEFVVSDLRGHTDDIICLQYKQDLLATGSGDGTIKLWDLRKKKCRATLKHKVDVFCLQMEGHLLASGGGERHISIWDMHQLEVVKKMPSRETMKCLQVKDNMLICGAADGFVHIYDIRSGTEEASFWACSEDVWALQFEGNRLVCGGVHPTQALHLWDIRNKSKVRDFLGHSGLVSALQFEGDVLLSGSADSTVKIWDMNTGKCTHTLANSTKVFCVYVHDGWVISGCDNAAAVLWDTNTGQQIRQYDGHADAILCAQFDPQRMVTGSYDKTIKVWDVID